MAKKNKSKNVKENKSYGKYILSIAAVLVLLIGASYAWLQVTLHGNSKATIKAGTLELTLDDAVDGNLINIEEAIPLSDSEGLATTPYKFSVKNTGTIYSNYRIYLDDAPIEDGITRMPDEVVKYNLKSSTVNTTTNNGNEEDNTEENTTTALVSSLKSGTDRVLVSNVTIAPNRTNNYELKLWIDEAATNEIADTIFSVKLRIVADQIQE